MCKHGHARLPPTLDCAVQHANAFTTAGPTVADHEAFWAEWALRIQTLEQGIEQARQQGISVSRAKRVLKELQAQANAAEAAAKLEALLLRKPCKASLLKVSPSVRCTSVDNRLNDEAWYSGNAHIIKRGRGG